MFTGNMKAMWLEEILKPGHYHLFKNTFLKGIVYIRIMTLNILMNAWKIFYENSVNWWVRPSESSDLNPIEYVWGSLKQ